MLKHVITAAALSALVACAAPAHSETASALDSAGGASASCDVRFTPTRDALRVEALVRSATSGEYELVVSKDGPNGTSDIAQSGPVEASDAEIVVSASEFNVERGDRYRARLVVRDETGALCSAERQS